MTAPVYLTNSLRILRLAVSFGRIVDRDGDTLTIRGRVNPQQESILMLIQVLTL